MSRKRSPAKDTCRPCDRCDCCVKNSEDFGRNKQNNNSKQGRQLTRIHITTTEGNCSSSETVTTKTNVSLDSPSSERFQVGAPLDNAPKSSIEKRDSALKSKEKRRCFGCKKKKKKSDKNSAAQTAEIDIRNNPTQVSDTTIGGKNKKQSSRGNPNSKKGDNYDFGSLEKRIGDADGGCPHCKKTNGLCNNNTIVFPRDQILRNNRFYDDGLENLRHLIKTEARWNSRTMEDILRELDKQRRDIKELKEMFDLFVRLSKENLMYQAFANSDPVKRQAFLKNGDKNKNDQEKPDDKHNLERKSNSTSINSLNPEENREVTDSQEIIKKQLRDELERDVKPPKKKAGWFKCFG